MKHFDEFFGNDEAVYIFGFTDDTPEVDIGISTTSDMWGHIDVENRLKAKNKDRTKHGKFGSSLRKFYVFKVPYGWAYHIEQAAHHILRDRRIGLPCKTERFELTPKKAWGTVANVVQIANKKGIVAVKKIKDDYRKEQKENYRLMNARKNTIEKIEHAIFEIYNPPGWRSSNSFDEVTKGYENNRIWIRTETCTEPSYDFQGWYGSKQVPRLSYRHGEKSRYGFIVTSLDIFKALMECFIQSINDGEYDDFLAK